MTDLRPFKGSLAWRRTLLIGLFGGLVTRALIWLSIDLDVFAGDAVGYRLLALNILNHRVFSLDTSAPFEPTLLRAPLLPLMASCVYGAFGTSMTAIRIFHALLSTGAALCLARALAKINERSGHVAFVAMMTVPFGALGEQLLLSETVAGAMLTMTIALPMVLQRGWAWATAGATLGCCILARDLYLPLVLILPIAAFALFREWRPAALLLIGATIVIAPWSVRNAVVAHAFVPVSRGLLGFNLWVGSWEHDGSWQTSISEHLFPDHAFDDPAAREEVAAALAAPASADAFFMHKAIERYKHHPVQASRSWFIRYHRLWLGTRSDLVAFNAVFAPKTPNWYALKFTLYALNALCLLLAAAGAWIWLGKSRLTVWLCVPIAFNALVYLPLHSTETRYTQPVYFLVVALASLGAVAFFERLVSRPKSRMALTRASRQAAIFLGLALPRASP